MKLKVKSSSVLLTIVTVVYNGEHLIEATIKSVANCKDESVEYIIIDGASKDKTIEKIKKYEMIVDQVLSEPDDGIFDAMNKGINLAKGDWLIFINAGDQILPNALKCVNLRECGGYGVVYGNTIRERYIRTFPYQVEMIETGNIPMCHQSTFYHRRMLGPEMYYNVSYRLFSENELFMRIYKCDVALHYVNCDIAYFLSGGISSSISNETRKAKYKYLFRNFGLLGVAKAMAMKLGWLKKEIYQLKNNEPYINEGAVIE